MQYDRRFDEAAALLIESLKDKNPAKRRAAVKALGKNANKKNAL